MLFSSPLMLMQLDTQLQYFPSTLAFRNTDMHKHKTVPETNATVESAKNPIMYNDGVSCLVMKISF